MGRERCGWIKKLWSLIKRGWSGSTTRWNFTHCSPDCWALHMPAIPLIRGGDARSWVCSLSCEHNWFHIGSKSMRIETKHKHTLGNRETHHVNREKLQKKFHLTHWLSIATHKWSIFPMFIYYLCVLGFCFSLSAIFSFSHFVSSSTIDLNWSHLARFFPCNNFSDLQFQLLCARREKKRSANEKCERMKSDLWISIGMRWNFSLPNSIF